jgi:hypothetical protein
MAYHCKAGEKAAYYVDNHGNLSGKTKEIPWRANHSTN